MLWFSRSSAAIVFVVVDKLVVSTTITLLSDTLVVTYHDCGIRRCSVVSYGHSYMGAYGTNPIGFKYG